MFTVKLIEDNGHEQLYPDIQTVTADPIPLTTAMSVAVWRAAPTEADGPIKFGTGGTVYVMNEHGSTISRYWLGASAQGSV